MNNAVGIMDTDFACLVEKENAFITFMDKMDVAEKSVQENGYYTEEEVEDELKEKMKREKTAEDRVDVEAIVASLVGAIPDTGKTLEEYRSERLKRYEISD